MMDSFLDVDNRRQWIHNMKLKVFELECINDARDEGWSFPEALLYVGTPDRGRVRKYHQYFLLLEEMELIRRVVR